MRLAILSDLHANREALAACIAHAEHRRADQVAFLGDLVGYGADPAWVVDTVMDYVGRGAIAVQGNHDYATTHEAPAGMPAQMQEALAWTRSRLRPEHLDFLAGLPLTQQHGHALFVHASAEDPGKWIYVTDAALAERSLRATRCRLVFSGHVHTPALYRRRDDGNMRWHAPASGDCVMLLPEFRYLAIPGSVGQPRDGGNGACYAIYDAATCELCFFRVHYGQGAV